METGFYLSEIDDLKEQLSNSYADLCDELENYKNSNPYQQQTSIVYLNKTIVDSKVGRLISDAQEIKKLKACDPKKRHIER